MIQGRVTNVGDHVTIGHACVVHGCDVADHVLIGNGSIILDDAEIGEYSLIGAGSVVTPRTKIPPRSLVLGVPGKVVREVTEEEVERIIENAQHYVELARDYLNNTFNQRMA